MVMRGLTTAAIVLSLASRSAFAQHVPSETLGIVEDLPAPGR